MSLTPGSRLGPYEVVSSLGAGGMGEVYKARDTRLSREVAIKPSPGPPGAHILRRFSDGQRFLVNTAMEEEAVVPMTLVLNWAASLKH